MRSISFLALFLVFTQLHADVIFSDSFESGDMSTTNQDGFSWGALNRTSIVTINPSCGDLRPGDPTVIFNGDRICNGPITGRDWQAYSGNNSLRFRYAANKPWTEQRFKLGESYPELWISYWIRVPINFSRGPGTNNKWFKIWMGDNSLYDNRNVSHFIARDWPGSPSSNIDVDLAYDNGLGSTHIAGRYQNFVTPSDAGRWMQNVYHMKASSGNGATDGRVAWYRRWDGDTAFETIADSGDIEMVISQTSSTSGFSGFYEGYILGYANAPYTKDTEWLLDSFIVSTSSLLSKPPKSPANIQIR